MAVMSVAANTIPKAPSRWSARLSLFALVLIVTALFLHRIFALPTPIAFHVIGVAYGLAALAVVLGLIAAIGIWRDGSPGAARILFGIFLGGLILATPLLLLALARNYPMLNDVTTSPENPPVYRALAGERQGMANPAAYPGEATAALQRKAYPDLVPVEVNRPLADTFDIVLDALRRLHFTIVTEEAPTEDDPVGKTEAVDRTLILGFYDDVAVRVLPSGENGARIDLRSSSRFGRSDYGRNAHRLREIMREIVARLEATVPAGGIPAGDTPNKKSVKPQKSGDQDPKAARKTRDGAPPNVRRAPERRAPPP